MSHLGRLLGVFPDPVQRRDYNIFRGPFASPAPPVTSDAYLTILPDPPYTPPGNYPGTLDATKKIWTVTPGTSSLFDYVFAWITPPASGVPTSTPRTGKRYFEIRFQSTIISGAPTEYYLMVGLFARAGFSLSPPSSVPVPATNVTNSFGPDPSQYSFQITNFPWILFSGGLGYGSQSTGATDTLCEYAPADFNRYGGLMDLVIGVAVDYDAGKMWIRNNSALWLTGDPTAGTSPLMSQFSAGQFAQCDPIIGAWRNGGPAGVDRMERVITLQSNPSEMTFGIPTGFTVQNLGSP